MSSFGFGKKHARTHSKTKDVLAIHHTVEPSMTFFRTTPLGRSIHYCATYFIDVVHFHLVESLLHFIANFDQSTGFRTS